MAALDFPNSPTVGQQFTATNGIMYTWDGAVWAAMPGSTGVYIGGSSPPSPPTGQMWWRSDPDQNLYVFYDDGNSKQWVNAVPTVMGGTPAGGDLAGAYPNPTLSARRSSVYKSNAGAFSIPNGAWTNISFDTIVDNAGGFYSAGASTLLTLTQAGTYLIGASMGWDGNSAGTVRALRLNVIGNVTRESDVKPLAFACHEVTTCAVVTAGATVQPLVYHDNGTAVNGNAGVPPILWAIKVG